MFNAIQKGMKMNQPNVIKCLLACAATVFSVGVFASEESDFEMIGPQEVAIEHVDYSLEIKPKQGWVTLGGLSKHDGKRLDNGQDYNEINPGLGYEYPLDQNWSISAGVFHNSFSKPSFYVAGFRQLFGTETYRFGVSGGLFTGYAISTIVPNLMPTFMYERERWGLNFFYSPSLRRGGERITNNTLIVQLKVKF